VTAPLVLAVDGGNSKTHLALVGGDGAVHALVRGPMSSPDHLGVEGSLSVLERLLDEAVAQARFERSERTAEVAHLLMAGVDSEPEEDEFREAIEKRGWAKAVRVGNDTFAVLRAGTEEGWGIAVTCGAGINCVGISRDGRQARFGSLGWITGDWGGGYDVGIAAVSAAARSQDGRGPRTSLERAVPAYFGVGTPHELAADFHHHRIPTRRVTELPPLVFSEARDDAVARQIVERLADEVVAMARVALVRLGLEGEPAEVLLGGGLLQSGDGLLFGAIERGIHAVGPALKVRLASSAPIVGAALLGLDELGADPAARERLRRELGAAVERVGQATETTHG
jgi:N-acetylglucosamine kinase-like BadF-type ATPase